MEDYYRRGLDAVVARANNGFRIGIPFIWCSNDLMVSFATQAALYRRMTGDRTLFTTADGIERLWALSAPLLQSPPPVRAYQPGSWGPNAIHQLIAPHAWRLPFERGWRERK